MYEIPNEFDLEEARRERDRRIARRLLIEEALAARSVAPAERRYAPLLAWVGRKMAAAGVHLQKTYAARVQQDLQDCVDAISGISRDDETMMHSF
jgi:hypothetical protein